MLNYVLLKEKRKYTVLETQTAQKILVFKTKTSASGLMDHLNLGGGFDGFTPSFVLRKVA
jgi:hypothetical protein